MDGFCLSEIGWLLCGGRCSLPCAMRGRTGQEEDLFVLDAAVPGLNKVREREAMRGAMEGAGGCGGGRAAEEMDGELDEILATGQVK